MLCGFTFPVLRAVRWVNLGQIFRPVAVVAVGHLAAKVYSAEKQSWCQLSWESAVARFARDKAL